MALKWPQALNGTYDGMQATIQGMPKVFSGVVVLEENASLTGISSFGCFFYFICVIGGHKTKAVLEWPGAEGMPVGQGFTAAPECFNVSQRMCMCRATAVLIELCWMFCIVFAPRLRLTGAKRQLLVGVSSRCTVLFPM